MQRETQLGYLMDYLEISGKELALVLGTDTTTISKWRNNKRKLTYASAEEIAKYLLSDDFKLKQNKIFTLLTDYLEEPDVAAYDKKIEALSLFLTDDGIKGFVNSRSSSKEIYKTSVSVYHGNQDVIKSAWENFFNSIIPEDTVYIGDFGDIQWGNSVSEEFLSYAVRKLNQIIQLETKVYIIDMVGEMYKAYEVLFRWISLYLNNNIMIYYIENLHSSVNKESFYVIPNKKVLLGQSTKEEYSENHVMIFDDEATSCFYTAKMKAIMDEAKQMIYKIEVRNALGMVEILDQYLKESQLTYMLNPIPTFRNMPIELLREILEDNQVTEDIIQQCIRINEKRHDIRFRCKYRQIYDLEAIEKAVRQEYLIEPELGYIVGREIRIKREFFLRQLSYISDYMASNMYMLALTNFEEIGFPKNNTAIIVQEDSLVVAWNAWEYKDMLYSKEYTFIGGFSEYMKEIWTKIPLINKSDEWTKKKLLSLADEFY